MESHVSLIRAPCIEFGYRTPDRTISMHTRLEGCPLLVRCSCGTDVIRACLSCLFIQLLAQAYSSTCSDTILFTIYINMPGVMEHSECDDIECVRNLLRRSQPDPLYGISHAPSELFAEQNIYFHLGSSATCRAGGSALIASSLQNLS